MAKNPALWPLLDLMADIPGASFFVKDRESRYIRANAGTRATYDLRRETDLVGRRARDFFPDLLAAAYEAEDRRVMDSGKAVARQIWLVPHIRGTPQWFVSSKAPLLDTEGNVIGLVGLMHPIATPEAERAHFRELQKVMAFLDTYYLEDLTVPRLAKEAGLSVPQFNRRFRQILRLSPMEYILSRRIQEAQRLLTVTNQPIGEIALATRFYDQSHFTKQFRQATGMTPLKYRRQYGIRN